MSLRLSILLPSLQMTTAGTLSRIRLVICAGEKNRSQVALSGRARDPASFIRRKLLISFRLSILHESAAGHFLHPHEQKRRHEGAHFCIRAGEKNRTPDLCLEGRCFTTKLHPQVSMRSDSLREGREVWPGQK
jgi:hypothetical protein